MFASTLVLLYFPPLLNCDANVEIITSQGYAIGTVCIIDTEPRESFDINDRRRLTEFARLAMDEIELAMRTRRATEHSSGELATSSDPSQALPAGLRGMTAVASEAGTIDASIAGKDIKKAIAAMDDFEVVETAVTLTEKDTSEQVKFRYGRNNTAEIEASAQGVETASRQRKPPIKSVKVVYPTSYKRSSIARGKRPAT